MEKKAPDQGVDSEAGQRSGPSSLPAFARSLLPMPPQRLGTGSLEGIGLRRAATNEERAAAAGFRLNRAIPTQL